MNISSKITALVLALGCFALGLQFNVSALQNRLRTEEEKMVVQVIRSADPAVVSVVVSKDIPVMEQYFEETEVGGNFRVLTERFRQIGTEQQQVSGGTAFFVSTDGLLITNQHVVSDVGAQYTVMTNDGQALPVEVMSRDAEMDLALLKVTGHTGPFPIIRISSNAAVELGQTVIAIGNALGEFRNTVSKGIISGIGRTVVAEDDLVYSNVMQTDAAINTGNSGGPLLNTYGELIGVNFSIVDGAENIGFAIPIDKVKRILGTYDQGLLKKNLRRVRQAQ